MGLGSGRVLLPQGHPAEFLHPALLQDHPELWKAGLEGLGSCRGIPVPRTAVILGSGEVCPALATLLKAHPGSGALGNSAGHNIPAEWGQQGGGRRTATVWGKSPFPCPGESEVQL